MINLELKDITIQVTHKKIKNLHLYVYPPIGEVKISAPKNMSIDTIRLYALSKLDWIKKQQNKFSNQTIVHGHQYINDENHYYNGKCYLLKLREANTPPQVYLTSSEIVLQIRPGTTTCQKEMILKDWYREQLENKVKTLIGKWEKIMKVEVLKFSIRPMKTRWGSCTPALKSIRINLSLAQKPEVHLEYVVVHELAHLIEPSHNHRFVAIMNKFMPEWRIHRTALKHG